MKTTDVDKKVGSEKARICVQLVRGLAGCSRRHKATVKGLGLKRVGQRAFVIETPCSVGMIRQVGYLLKVQVPNQD